MGLQGVLVDRARPLRKREAGRRVEGRTIRGVAPGEWFKCRLTLPSAVEDSGATAGVRPVTTQPMLLLGVKDLAGEPLVLHNDLRLEINSRQLGLATWDVVGEPEPLRKKRRVIGYQAAIRRVTTQDADQD